MQDDNVYRACSDQEREMSENKYKMSMVSHSFFSGFQSVGSNNTVVVKV